MVVEDDEDILDIIHYILTSDGYEVIATKGYDTCSLAQDQQPDMILLDVRLECGFGDAICRQLKQNEETMKIPVILISAVLGLEDLALSACADGFLNKPFDVDDLLSLVAKTVKGEQNLI